MLSIVSCTTYVISPQIYTKIFHEISWQTTRLDSGVEKLTRAQTSIDELQLVLAEKETQLQAAADQADQVLELVTLQAHAAEQVRNRVQSVKEECEIIVRDIKEKTAVAHDLLEEARPALLEAEDALNTIRPVDITTLRKLQKPPHLIMRILDCVLLLHYHRMEPVRADPERGTFLTSWNESLRFMNNALFLTNLLHFPRKRITEEHIDLLEPYVNGLDYNLSVARKVCGNVAGLLSWTLAMIKYHWVSKTVTPLQDKLTFLEQRLKKANKRLQTSENVLSEKTSILNKVQADYDSALRQKLLLEDDTKICFDRMSTANQLLENLSTEYVRWSEESLELKTQLNELIGDSIQLAAFMVYCGALDQTRRMQLLRSWQMEVIKRNIPHRHKFDFIKVFTDQATVSGVCVF